MPAQGKIRVFVINDYEFFSKPYFDLEFCLDLSD